MKGSEKLIIQVKTKAEEDKNNGGIGKHLVAKT